MFKIVPRIFLGLTFCLFFILHGNSFASETIDHAVRLSVSYDTTTTIPLAKLSWQPDTDAFIYRIYKKTSKATSWTYLKTLDSTATFFIDSEFTMSQGIEYKVVKVTHNYNGYGYIYSGLNLPVVENRGRVLLLVDETVVDSLKDELDRFKKDLIGDGWRVSYYKVPRAETFNPVAVWKVKNIIDYEYSKPASGLKSLILFGRVPVPFSGDYPYDGHPEHAGAWSSDAFYGVINGLWSDIKVDDTVGVFPQNHNVPFDGKFDQEQIPKNSSLEIGRIDFYNLPIFPQTEIELLRNYLDKDHDYRIKQTPVRMKALIDDGFGMYPREDGEAFASVAWMNFSALVTPDSIDTGHTIPLIQINPYIWAYGCNPGSFNSVALTIYSDQLAQFQIKCIFTMFFGSWLGEFDSQDNILRCAVASSPSVMGSCWGNRPFWFVHKMALGETIGSAELLTQNNDTLYRSSGYDGIRGIHVDLMGDPTVRMNLVAPPTFVKLITNSTNSGKIVISWGKSNDNVIGYYVYRAPDYDSAFVRITDFPVTDTILADESPLSGRNIYMVRALTLQNDVSGTFYNLSQGTFLDVDDPTDVKDFSNTEVDNFNISPNPAIDQTAFYFNLNHPSLVKISIYDLNGNKISEPVNSYFNSGLQKVNWNFAADHTMITPGIYFSQISADNKITVAKFIVMP